MRRRRFLAVVGTGVAVAAVPALFRQTKPRRVRGRDLVFKLKVDGQEHEIRSVKTLDWHVP